MCSFDIVLATKGTITGNAEISNLPFASASGSDFRYAGASFGLWQNLATSYVYLSGIAVDNSAKIELKGATAAAAALSSLTTANLLNNSRLSGTIVYRSA